MPSCHRLGWRSAAVPVVCLLLSTPAFAQPAQPQPSLRIPTIAAGAAAAADWVSTYHALTNYHLRETNPFLRPWYDSPGQLVSVGAAVDVGLISVWNLSVGPKHPRLAATGLWAMAAFRSYLVVHNLRNERRAARR